MIHVVDMTLLAFLASVAIAVTRMTNLFATSVLTGVYSLLMACIFTVLDAVDVAFTEAAVGAGISTVLFLSNAVSNYAARKTTAVTQLESALRRPLNGRCAGLWHLRHAPLWRPAGPCPSTRGAALHWRITHSNRRAQYGHLCIGQLQRLRYAGRNRGDLHRLYGRAASLTA